MQPDIKALVVASGPQKERIGKILPYPGTWIHIEFEDGKKPQIAYLPQKAVRFLNEVS